MTGSATAISVLLAVSTAWTVLAASTLQPPMGWQELGVAITAGPDGSWDAVLSGSFSPCEAVRFKDRYLLYYIGASGIRDDGGPANRALGVAISQDGQSFRKSRRNPVLTRQGHGPNRAEEGLFSCAALVHDDTLWLWYGGLFEQGPEEVSSSIMLARSRNGLRFEELGTVVSWEDTSVWNSGDELFPVGAWHDGEWHVLYVSKGRVGEWLVGLASGPRPDQLERTGPALDLGPGQVAGGGSVESGLVPFVVGFENRNILWFRVAGRKLEATGFMERVANMGHIAMLDDGSRWLSYARNRDEGRIRVFEAMPPSTGE